MPDRSDNQSTMGGPPMVLYVGATWRPDVVSALEPIPSGFRISKASNAPRARTELEQADFDCVVVEYVLSDETGTEFLSHITGEDAEIPTILLASQEREPTPSEVVTANVTAYLQVEQLTDRHFELAECIETVIEQSREEVSERFQAALTISDTGAWEYDIRADAFWWSETASEMHGLDPGTSPPPDQIVARYVQRDQRTLRTAFDQAITEGDAFDVTLELDRDEKRWIRIRGHPVTETETLRYVRGSCQDITNLKRREEQLEMLHSAGQQLMQATSRKSVAQITIEAAKNILGYARAALRLVDENEETLRIYATTAENVAAAGDRPDYRIDEDVLAAQTYRRGEPTICDDLDVTQDEYERGALRSGLYVPVGDYGVFSCGDLETDAYDETDASIIHILTKLSATALTRVESDRKLRQTKEQLEQFTGIVAHDLRNPINVAQGHLELARQSPDGKHFDTIDDALKRMESMIDDLLTLARAGKSIDTVEAVSLADAADEAYQHVQSDGISLRVEEDVIINADRERLLHLLENLFRNTIDHNEPPVSLTVGRIDNTTDGSISTAGLFVADDGSGIPPDERDEVFDHGYSSNQEGTGFGLSIVRHVADAHNWDVALTEGPDGGARFEFTSVELTREISGSS